MIKPYQDEEYYLLDRFLRQVEIRKIDKNLINKLGPEHK